VVVHTDVRLIHVDVPVAQPVEAVRDHRLVAECSGKLERLLDVLARPRVLMPRPQRSEVEERLSLRVPVAGEPCSS
jgi:hypothetical protein